MRDTELDELDPDQDIASSLNRRITVSKYDPFTGTFSSIYYPDYYPRYPGLYPDRFYG